MDSPIRHPAVFPWHDEGVVGRTPPLALAARMACLIEDLGATALESTGGGDAVTWLEYGLSGVIRSLEKAGELDKIGVLLTGLEGLAAPERRARWPLNDQIVAEHPVIGMGLVQLPAEV